MRRSRLCARFRDWAGWDINNKRRHHCAAQSYISRRRLCLSNANTSQNTEIGMGWDDKGHSWCISMFVCIGLPQQCITMVVIEILKQWGPNIGTHSLQNHQITKQPGFGRNMKRTFWEKVLGKGGQTRAAVKNLDWGIAWYIEKMWMLSIQCPVLLLIVRSQRLSWIQDVRI